MPKYTRKQKRRKNSKKQRGGNKEICTAIIVEPRKHKALSFVLKNILENLDSNWNVRVYHGNKNKEFVENILKTNFADFSKRISAENLGFEDLKGRGYSELFMSSEFTEKIPTETFLVFQTDCMINSKHRGLIHKFMKYDYVGAPWKDIEMKQWIDHYSSVLNHDKPYDYSYVGNGGFSLRKKSKMLKILKSVDNFSDINEDVLFSIGSKTEKPYKPSTEEAKEFAIEMIYSPKSFGIHKCWRYLSVEENAKVINDCPGLQTLIDLQGEF